MTNAGEITIKQEEDGSWSYYFKNIKVSKVIAQLEIMKYLLLKEELKKAEVKKTK